MPPTAPSARRSPSAPSSSPPGDEIRYAGPSGIGPINKQNDPSSAFVGIYTFDNNNKNIFSTTVEGSVE